MNRDPSEPIDNPDYPAATLAIIFAGAVALARFICVLLAIVAATIGLVHHG